MTNYGLKWQVLGVKQRIEGEKGFAVAQQKLIHAGKVLKDDSKLAEYNIKENDFLVVMVTKVRIHCQKMFVAA